MQMVCVFFSVRAAITIEMNVGRDMKRAQFVHLQKLSFSYYNTTLVGYIHARVMSDTSKIASVIAWGLVDMFWAFGYVLGVFAIMFALNWKLAAIIMLVVPFIAGLTFVFSEKDVVLEPGYPGDQFRNNRSVLMKGSPEWKPVRRWRWRS